MCNHCYSFDKICCVTSVNYFDKMCLQAYLSICNLEIHGCICGIILCLVLGNLFCFHSTLCFGCLFLKVHANVIRMIIIQHLCADTTGRSNSFFFSLAADPECPNEVLFFIFILGDFKFLTMIFTVIIWRLKSKLLHPIRKRQILPLYF